MIWLRTILTISFLWGGALNILFGQGETDSLYQQLNKVGKSQKIEVLKSIAEAFEKNDFQNVDQSKLYEYLRLSRELKLPADIANAYVSIALYNERNNSDLILPLLDSAYHWALQSRDKAVMARVLNKMAKFLVASDQEKAMARAGEALKFALEAESRHEEGLSYNIMGFIFFYQGDYGKALENFKRSLEISHTLNLKKQEALLLNNLGVIYRTWGDYTNAVGYFQQALRIQEQLGLRLEVARTNNNLGNVYFDWGVDMDRSLEFYSTGLKIFTELRDTVNLANTLNSIGLVYQTKKDYDTAKRYYNQSLDYFIKVGNQSGIASSMSNLGDLAQMHGDYPGALEYFGKAIGIYQSRGEMVNVAFLYKQIAGVYQKQGRWQAALDYYSMALDVAQKSMVNSEIVDIYGLLAKLYADQGMYKESVGYYQKYSELKDSVFKQDYLDQVSELQTKYETDKKEQEIKLHKSELLQKEIEIKRGRVVVISIGGGFLLILIFSILLYKQYNQKRKANVLLQQQNEEIRKQRDQIMRQKQEITDSIRYASKIQTAILPPYKQFHEVLPEHFVFFKPRDIVSGDFYWLMQKGERTIVVAADCTGHGVPGAFMSMLGMAYLNEIVVKENVLEADVILNLLRANIINALHQTGELGESQDGMDIALCIIDKSGKNPTIEYAGAFNPLFLIRDGQLNIFEADKMPIGFFVREQQPFKKHTIQLQPGDVFYIFSDGYADQFGGEKYRKFMIKRFKDLLLNIFRLPMEKQRLALEETLERWKNGHDQVDDILVIGIRVT